MPRTIKKARNPSLHPIAGRWPAPGELFVHNKIVVPITLWCYNYKTFRR